MFICISFFIGAAHPTHVKRREKINGMQEMMIIMMASFSALHTKNIGHCVCPVHFATKSMKQIILFVYSIIEPIRYIYNLKHFSTNDYFDVRRGEATH